MSEQIAEQATEEAVVETPVAEESTEQATVERDTEQDTLDIPDSSVEGGKARYVPLAAVEGARKEIKELRAELSAAKEGSAKAQHLESRIDELSSQLAQIAPKAQAYDAAVAAQQQRQEPQDDPQDRAELEEIARDFDFYKPDGQLDLVKAQRHQARTRREADKIAQERIAPYARHAVNDQAEKMYGRAKATLDKFGVDVPEATLRSIWSGVEPSLASTVEGAKWLLTAAVGAHQLQQWQAGGGKPQQQAQRAADGKFAKAEIGDPLYTEKAGGRDTPEAVKLSPQELKYIKDAGITEKEYHESAKSAPWLRR